MSIKEICSCGAVLQYVTPSEVDMHAVIDMFHLAHGECSKEG